MIDSGHLVKHMEINKNMQVHLLETMILIRRFEAKVSELKNDGVIFGSVHCCDGEEAIPVGVCSALNIDDYLISNHRPHGHAIAKGVSVNEMMAEMLGKATGTNGGKGGSMHVNDPKVGMINATGIVASGLPIACGAAFSAKQNGDKKIACVFFGDGSANEGILHECLNLAAVWNLPVLFVLEDNDLAITANTNLTSACQDYVKLAEVYGIRGEHVNGQDVENVYYRAKKSIQYIRNNSKPYFLQCKTVRFREHAEGPYYSRMISTNYRDNKRLEMDIATKDPIALYSKKLLECGILDKEDVQSIWGETDRKILDSLRYAELSPIPDASSAFRSMFSK